MNNNFYQNLLGRTIKSSTGNIYEVAAVWLDTNTNNVQQVAVLVIKSDGNMFKTYLPNPDWYFEPREIEYANGLVGKIND